MFSFHLGNLSCSSHIHVLNLGNILAFAFVTFIVSLPRLFFLNNTLFLYSLILISYCSLVWDQFSPTLISSLKKGQHCALKLCSKPPTPLCFNSLIVLHSVFVKNALNPSFVVKFFMVILSFSQSPLCLFVLS